MFDGSVEASAEPMPKMARLKRRSMCANAAVRAGVDSGEGKSSVREVVAGGDEDEDACVARNMW